MTKKPSIRYQKWRPQTWDDALVVVPDILREKKPLVIGVHLALYAIKKDCVSKASIRALISHHTRATPYLRALGDGGPRYSLSGVQAGEITAVQIQRARRALSKREKFEKQKSAA